MTEGTPTTSFCSSTTVRIGYSSNSARRGLFYFDLSGYKGGQTVTAADVKLYCEGGSTTNSADYLLKRVKAPGGTANAQWTIDATWNKYDGTHSWTNAGGDFATSPTYDTTTLSCTSTGYKNWSATALVQDWLDGTLTNYGVLLRQSGESTTNLLDFTSADSTSSNKPKLVLTYTNTAPGTATSLAPANGTVDLSATPTLSGTYNDVDAGDAGYPDELHVPVAAV